MIEIKGKYNSCKVFNDTIDESTTGQLTALMNQECISNSKVRIMSDCHAGKGCVIGTTMTLRDRVIPNLVGVDIGCGVLVIRLKEKSIDLPKLDSVIHNYVPSGMDIHKEGIADFDFDFKCKVNEDRALRSIGTLGGGNHFIEVDKDKDENLYLVIHTGSRHLGIEVCDYYQDLGYQKLKEQASGGSLKEKTKELIAKLKLEGRDKELSKAIKKLKEEYKSTSIDISHELAYVSGVDFEDYIHDMRLAQQFAKLNRQTIAKVIMKNMGFHEVEQFDTIHNYIDTDNMILRKGSVSAQNDEKLIIPMNMRDGSLLCIGKGNEDWNYSAPHGAGRLMSRSKAKESISMNEFKESMQGIYTTTVNKGTLDESPMAYKSMESIVSYINDTVDIIEIVKPIYNFKASEVLV